MGYTHYWYQQRSFTKTEWLTLKSDMLRLFDLVRNEMQIPLADAHGDIGTRPHIDNEEVFFNGLGDDAHETMCILRARPPTESWQTPEDRGFGFCKTACKPYDCVVTATLCYLATVMHTHRVSSDGEREDWDDGLALARRAWPQYTEQLANPIGLPAAA